MTRHPMTPAGLQQLKDELKRLKSVERPKVIDAIATARDHGDISENAEYDAAKEQQAFIENRIREIENKIAGAQVVDPSILLGVPTEPFNLTPPAEAIAFTAMVPAGSVPGPRTLLFTTSISMVSR